MDLDALTGRAVTGAYMGIPYTGVVESAGVYFGDRQDERAGRHLTVTVALSCPIDTGHRIADRVRLEGLANNGNGWAYRGNSCDFAI